MKKLLIAAAAIIAVAGSAATAGQAMAHPPDTGGDTGLA